MLNNIVTLVSLILLASFIANTTVLQMNKKSWIYEIKSFATTSSDTEKFNATLEIVRVSRGVYAISGDVFFNIDIVEGDSNTVEAKCYRSSKGSEDFQILPLQMTRKHFFEFLNTYYKDIVMDSLHKCSNLPYFENKFQPPIKKTIYRFNECRVSQDGMPSHLEEGLYKLSFIAYGEVQWTLDFIAEVTLAVT